MLCVVDLLNCITRQLPRNSAIGSISTAGGCCRRHGYKITADHIRPERGSRTSSLLSPVDFLVEVKFVFKEEVYSCAAEGV